MKSYWPALCKQIVRLRKLARKVICKKPGDEMRITPALWLSALLALSIGCGKDRQLTKAELPTINSETVAVETPKPPAKVTREAAIATAKTHYIKTLGSLKGIDFDASEEANGWHVNYYPHVRNGTIAGGGG